jgi:hypothetical protein
VKKRGYEGLVAKDEASAYESGRTTPRLTVKQEGWTVEEDRWRRRMLRCQHAPLFVLERVAVAVKSTDLFVRQRVDLHHGQGLVHGLIAGGALLPVPWTSERSRSAATRQSAIVELLPDEIADGSCVH